MLLFAGKVADEILLSVPHRFWTFSIPRAVRGIMLRDRRLLKLLSRCAFKAVKQAMKETLPRGAAGDGIPGAILAIHTAGNLLQWNPHIHGIVTEGFFDREGRFFYLPDLDPKLVEILFEEKLLKDLLKKKRISPGLVSSMATWRHSGFSTHSKPAPADPSSPLKKYFGSETEEFCPRSRSGTAGESKDSSRIPRRRDRAKGPVAADLTFSTGC